MPSTPPDAGPLTPREALDRLAALCDDAAEGHQFLLDVDDVRAVLAEVSPPEAGGVLDRDQARAVLDDTFALWPEGTEALLDRLARCVRPAAIDRDALCALIERDSERESWSVEQFADRILALVRPVAGVTLTPGEAALALDLARQAVAAGGGEYAALAGRLKMQS